MIPKLLPAICIIIIALVVTQNLKAQQRGHISNRSKIIFYDSVHHRPIFNNNYFTKDNLKDASLAQSSFLRLTKDIDTSSDSHIGNYANTSYTNLFAVLKNTVYYVANDGVHGFELWKSNGTTEGTKMVKDIYPGVISSNATNLIVFNNKLYFIASTTGYYSRLWESDGTNAGTKMFNSMNGYYPFSITVVNGQLFIISIRNYAPLEWEVWKSDGTDQGTVPAFNLTAQGVTQVFHTVAVNNLLYFTAYDASNSNNELWRSDGTAGGTFMLKDINPNPYGEGPLHMTAYNNHLYFFEVDGTGRHLFVSDGSIAGTDYAPGNNGVTTNSDGGSVDDEKPLTVAGNAIYFEGLVEFLDWGVYKYNGMSGTGTTLVKSIYYNQNGRVPINHIGSTAYFILYDNNFVPQLWSTEGPSGSAVKVVDLPDAAPVTKLTNSGNLMYFNVATSATGNEVWRSDGTAANTYLLKDVNPGALSSDADLFTYTNGKTFFTATTLANGNELWISDGSTSNTSLLRDINTHATEGSHPSDLTVLNNKIIFAANTKEKGREPYVSNGTSTGTFIIKDILKGEQSSLPSDFQVKGSYVYFLAGESNNAIYKTDGMKSNAVMLFDFGAYARIYDYAVADNNVVFLVLYNGISGYYELWRTNGTSEGTYLLTSSTSYNSGSMVTMDNKSYLPWDKLNGSTGTELWTSDGTPGGTKMVKDIFTGTNSSSPHNLYVYKDTLYFGAHNGTGDALWKTDGTNAGTKKIKAVNPGSFYATDSTLFFTGNTAGYGNELWKTDGTATGTIRVKDIYSGPSSSNPSSFAHIKNTLFFIADDGMHGSQLWKTNGTGSGTQLLTQLNLSYVSGFGNFTVVAGDKLYLRYLDTTGRYSLAISDGTKKGTHTVDDSLVNALDIVDLAGAGNQLFLVGEDYVYGQELYAGEVSSPAKSAPVYTMAKIYPENVMRAQVGNNPFHDQLNLNIYTQTNEKVQIQVTSIAGTVYYDNLIGLSAGLTTHKISTGTWANGFYIIHIFDSGMKSSGVTLKVIKAK